MINTILELYTQYEKVISFVKDIAFFAGAVGIFIYIKNKPFTDKVKSIKDDLKSRNKLESTLDNFVFETAKGTKDIALRFVHWKNYPYDYTPTNDGFKFNLRIEYLDNKPHMGWLNNTGINFEDLIWFWGNSLYIDSNQEIFFIAPQNSKFKGFEEISNVNMIFQLPFTNIIDYDFRERIEYEPIIYIKHPYSQHRKLFNKKVQIREREGYQYINIELNQNNKLEKYSKSRLLILRAKIYLTKLLKKAA